MSCRLLLRPLETAPCTTRLSTTSSHWAGPGLRWGAMGPHMLFNLGAGEGGMKSFCERYADSFHRWWDDLGTMQLDAGIGEILEKGLADEANGKSVEELSEERNALITAHLKAVKDLR